MCAELLKQMSMKTRTGPTISALMSSLVLYHHTHTRISFMLQTEAFVFLLVFVDTQSGAKNVVPIFHQQVLPSIANAHPAVRNMAVVCLGTCTLHSKELAKTHMVLLLQVNAK